MSKLTFITGGARSGKSSFAQKLAMEYKRVCYVATADPAQSVQANDDEMLKRIQKHRDSRPANWQTIEAPLEIDKAIANINSEADVILIDCITIYITNLLLKGPETEEKEENIIDAINRLCIVCKEIPSHVIIVSNEVGCGIVPDNPLSRKFRDIAGNANQIIAREADNVFLVTSGIEMKIK